MDVTLLSTRVELGRIGLGALVVALVAGATIPTILSSVTAAAATDPLPKCGPDRGTNPLPPETVQPPVAGDISLELVGRLGGRFKPTVAVGTHLYTGVGNQIVVLSLADPRKPKQVGDSAPLPGVVEGLAASGDQLLAAAGPAGLLVLDVSSAAQPQVVSSLELPGYAEDVALAGGIAYVANGTGGLRIIDVGDPVRPVPLGVAYDLHNILGVAIEDGFAHLAAADEGLLVADVSDRSAPVEAGGLLTGGFAYGIDVRNEVAYLADAWRGLQLIDVSAPAAPRKMGRSRTKAWAMDVTIKGSRAYLAAGSQGLRIVDIRNPRRPVLLGARAVPIGHAAHVFVRKGFAYLSDIFAGIRALNVRRPARPRATGRFVPTGTAEHVGLRDQFAYVSARTFGAKVVDVSDPSHPSEVRSLLDSGRDLILTASPIGNLAFVTTGLGAARPPDIITLDISSPGTPEVLSRYRGFPGAPRAVAVQGTTLYYPIEFGLVIVDGSRDPPCQLSFLQTSDDALRNATVGVGVAGDVAYTAISEGGIGVVDVGEPSDPRLLSTVDTNAFATLPVGETLFVYGLNRLESYDISDPLKPVFLDSMELPGQPRFFQMATPLAYGGGKLFVANDDAGLIAVDTSQPNSLRIAGRIRLPGKAISVTTDADHAYVASIRGGLSVVGWDQVEPSMVARPMSSTRREASSEGGIPSRTTEGAVTAARSAGEERCIVRTRRDSGRGSLRRCLLATSSGGRVRFDLSTFTPDDPVRIRLESELPPVGPGGSVDLDGTGAGVILDGQDRVPTGLNTASRSTIRGLRIENFTRAGVALGGRRATVRDNVISSNGGFGIFTCCDGTGGRNTITGNRIGTDATGTAPGGHQFLGVQLGSPGNTVGGPRPQDRNVISGNIVELSVDSDGNKVIGNRIRTNVTGTSLLRAPDATATINFSTGARNRFVDNVIAGGVFVSDHGAFYNSFLGNHIGVDATGTTLFAEPHTGLFIGEPYNRVENNLLTAMHLPANDTVVLGNRIVREAGFAAVKGIESSGGRHNFIGGRSPRGPNDLVSEGIRLLEGARDNSVIGNRFEGGSEDGLGISIVDSGQNSIVANEIADLPVAGILLRDGAWANFVRGNELRRNSRGIWVQDAGDNAMSLNAFFDNTTQATDEGTANLWDLLGLGNFWSDYLGQDVGADGIGDTERAVPPNGVDRYPLMVPPL